MNDFRYIRCAHLPLSRARALSARAEMCKASSPLTRVRPSHNLPVMRGLGEAELDRVFTALADPTRRAILARLRMGEAGVLELAERFPISQPAISKHLKVLESAGLISRRRRAKHHLCRLEPRRLKDVVDWLGTYREFWEESFSRLDSYLETLDSNEAT
jgi:DNA-binding transcriptional ArsR family regulator